MNKKTAARISLLQESAQFTVHRVAGTAGSYETSKNEYNKKAALKPPED
jgi:hypothetical protein